MTPEVIAAANAAERVSRPAWRRTWAVGPLGVEEWAARSGDFFDLRLYRIVGGPRDGQWRWSVGRDFAPVGEGYAGSAAGGARAAERAMAGARRGGAG